MNRRLTLLLAAIVGASGVSASGIGTVGTAHAQMKEVELDHGPTRELYIRKRPPVPASPKIPKILDKLLGKKIKLRNAKRAEAIKLLKAFLGSKPSGDIRAEGLFKLAELLWEDGRRAYIAKMDKYERKLEACRRRGPKCRKPPKEPRLDFTLAAKYYKTLLRDHPTFRRTDLVLYLVGFAAKEGGKNQESLTYFAKVIKQFPNSPLYGDSWMMIGEYYFASRKWNQARQAYARILAKPKSATYDLALFKTAWCDWKLGDHKLAARRFKQVLDLAEAAKRSSSARLRRRRAQLRDQALDYLVIVFTEDQTISAKEIYDFLASIGGERYSHDVLVRVADAYYINTEYERSVGTYRFLMKLKPTAVNNANYQRRIIEAYLNSDEDKAIASITDLANNFGPNSTWAKANKRFPGKLRRNLKLNEALVGRTAKNFHADAQTDEKRAKRPNLRLYLRASKTYQTYLKNFPKHKNAAEMRFLRAEILRIKLKKYEQAGDEYLAVGKTAPVGQFHKDALLRAMASFEKARPKNIKTGRRELLPVDRKFAAAVDLYATLFPADPKLVGVIFRNGKMFYDYGDYDEAIKRFGLIVTKYPNHEAAAAAGDRILTALAKAEDYENIEDWARKLRKAKGFQTKSQQARLSRLIIESIVKNGDKHVKAGKYTRAANFYLRIPKEFPKHPSAAKAMYNAAVSLEKAKRPGAAGRTYVRVAKKYGRSQYGAKSAFTAGQVYESMVYYDRAAEAYELLIKKFIRSKYAADALFNAGVLRQALGEHRKASSHYKRYSRRFRRKKDASSVAFRIGVVFETAGDDGRAERAFRDYARRYRSSGKHVIESFVRAGRTAHRLGHPRRASRYFRSALQRYKRLRKKAREKASRWAAEARYFQAEAIYKRYVAIKFDVDPNKLTRTLKRKSRMLGQAQKVYVDVVKYADPLWTTASLYRIGSIYEEFSKALTGAEVPPKLPEKQKEAYRDALNNHVVTIEQKASALFEKGYKKAMALQVYNKFTRKMREGLGRLKASEYPPENEGRARVRLGDRPPRLQIVDEVVRD